LPNIAGNCYRADPVPWVKRNQVLAYNLPMPDGPVPPPRTQSPSKLSLRERLRKWANKKWWELELGYSATPQDEHTFETLLNRARSTQATLESQAASEKRVALRYGIRDEIRRDIVPFYFLAPLGRGTRKDFIDVRSEMWRDHVDTFSKIASYKEPEKEGSSKIDYVAGHLDIIDRKFGVLLQGQGLIGVVVSLGISTFKDDVVGLLKSTSLSSILITEIPLLAAFLFFASVAAAMEELSYLVPIALLPAIFLYSFKDVLPPSLAPALIAFFGGVWFITTLFCLRGTGRARWGEMKKVESGADNLKERLDKERDYQVTNLIRALVGRTALLSSLCAAGVH
jgi:hypothetical protein